VINRLTHRSNLNGIGKKNLYSNINNKTPTKSDNNKNQMEEGADNTSFVSTGKTEHPRKYSAQDEKKADDWFQGFSLEY
jgi:hypothetical protein